MTLLFAQAGKSINDGTISLEQSQVQVLIGNRLQLASEHADLANSASTQASLPTFLSSLQRLPDFAS